ncbi:hypothetical protein ET33_13360 [Paenibacillus tyrfis]|uniref:Uncharacterized protein n=1 Tax=Paenibacillus tyrfis TaxID=1501230 RepID=A0A081PAE9_9BACL|nr:hypothetical protein ET33_13360 [Paenibacillus tyrfis]
MTAICAVLGTQKFQETNLSFRVAEIKPKQNKNVFTPLARRTPRNLPLLSIRLTVLSYQIATLLVS